MYALRLAGCSTGLGFALGRFGGKTTPGGLVAPAVAAHGRRRGVSATSNAAAPVPGDQGVGMDPAKQQQQQAPEGKKQDMPKTEHWDVMTHSFGVVYSTRSDEEGFGGVYGQNDPVENPGTEVHPNHPHAPEGKKQDMPKTKHWDVMTHSFGEGYATRCDEEGFGGVYGQNDPVENPGTEVHPNHPEYDTSQGSEVKEKEKARHLKDDKHAT